MLKERKESFLASVPINSYFVKLLKRVYDNDYAIYLEEEFGGFVKSLVKEIYPLLDIKLISLHYGKNSDEIHSLTDRYSFYSYGDQLFSEILFIFASTHFPDSVQRYFIEFIYMFIKCIDLYGLQLQCILIILMMLWQSNL